MQTNARAMVHNREAFRRDYQTVAVVALGAGGPSGRLLHHVVEAAQSLGEVDAAHDGFGVVVEVEAGRGARGNAAYRDLVRTSLIVDARYLALLMPIVYRAQSAGRSISVPAFRGPRPLGRPVRQSKAPPAVRRCPAGRILTQWATGSPLRKDVTCRDVPAATRHLK
jgi:hypothetical protein